MKNAKWILLALVLLTGILYVLRPNSETPQAEPQSISVVEETQSMAPIATVEPNVAEPPAPENKLMVTVLDEAAKAIPGATIRVFVEPTTSSLNQDLTTSASGTAEIPWPTTPFDLLQLIISKDNFASKQISWDLIAGDKVPMDYAATLQTGVKIGGYVLDSQGNPIPDASVSLFRYFQGGEDTRQKNEISLFASQNLTTSADGSWHADKLPPDLLHRINIYFSHTNYLGVTIAIDKPASNEKELRDHTHRILLQTGLTVAGRVLNELHQPIPGATVWAGKKYTRERKETKTDAEGRFTLRAINQGSIDFSVAAKGCAPAAKIHKVSSDSAEEILFILSPGSVIRGIVLDRHGDPIEGVRVLLEGGFSNVGPGITTWITAQAVKDSDDRIEFSTTTGEDGRFEWDAAPNKPMAFYFAKTGYSQKRNVRLGPGKDHVITLDLPRKIIGQVVDAETGQSIPKFSICLGQDSFDTRLSNVQVTKNISHPEGRFTLETTDPNEDAVEAVAPEYAEQIKRLPKPKNNVVEILVKLKPSPALRGIVVGPDTIPIPGVTVALVDSSEKLGGRYINFSGGKIQTRNNSGNTYITDATGHFQIPSPPEKGLILASATNGFGKSTIADLRSSGVITLRTFGRIEGRFVNQGQPKAGQQFNLSSPNAAVFFDFADRQTTDADGKFIFENVPPGDLALIRMVQNGARSWAHSHRTDVTVKPGETAYITLGDTDAVVSGKVRFEGPAPEGEYTVGAQLSSRRSNPPAGSTLEQLNAFYASPEYKDFDKTSKHYSAHIGPDGELTLDSVAPGTYTLRVTAKQGNSISTPPLADYETVISIPEGANPNNPISIPDVVLKLK